jgi:hypothetical protein
LFEVVLREAFQGSAASSVLLATAISWCHRRRTASSSANKPPVPAAMPSPVLIASTRVPATSAV